MPPNVYTGRNDAGRNDISRNDVGTHIDPKPGADMRLDVHATIVARILPVSLTLSHAHICFFLIIHTTRILSIYLEP